MRILTEQEAETLRAQFPDLPAEYWRWLLTEGCGRHQSGYEIFAAPRDSADQFGELSQRSTGYFLLIGNRGWDDWIGYHYRHSHGWLLVLHDAYDFGVTPIPEGLAAYLNRQQRP